MTTRKYGIQLAIVALAVLALPAPAPAAAPPAVHVLSCLAKPSPAPPSDAFLAQFETPPVIHAAWGEAEALQLLVVTPAGGLSGLRVRSGGFVRESGDALGTDAVTASFVTGVFPP